MFMQSVGIHSLAVRFPRTTQTHQDWLQTFPELGVQRLRNPTNRLPFEQTGNPTGLDIWLQAVTPYLSDPFRGSIERRVLAADESGRSLEYQAAQAALQAAHLTPNQVDLVLVAALFPETVGPGHAAYLAHDLGLHCPAWNLESTCASALIALQTAQALVQTETYHHVLIVVSHLGSQAVHEADTLSWSMGDGVGALVVGRVQPDQGILSTHVMSTASTCGAYLHELAIDAHGKPWRQTRTGDDVSVLAETAVDFVRDCCHAAVQKAGVSLDQIDFFAFNTPTAWYTQVCTTALSIPPERTLSLYPQYANIGPVFPVANLYHAVQTEEIRADDLVLVYANGAAATAAAMVMRWGNVALGEASTVANTPTIAAEPIQLAIPATQSELPGDRLQKTLLAATPNEQYSILEAYLIQWLAQTRQIDFTQIDAQDFLATLLDSLLAIVLRNHLETELQVHIPMEHFFGSYTIADLAELLLHQLAVVHVMTSVSGTTPPASHIEREIISL